MTAVQVITLGPPLQAEQAAFGAAAVVAVVVVDGGRNVSQSWPACIDCRLDCV